MRRIVYFLAKSIYCSKQQSPYHSVQMRMLIRIFVISQTPHMNRLFYFFVLITCQRNIIDDADNNNNNNNNYYYYYYY